jgi:DNA-binding transcriptional ArsR family regulator
VRGIPASQFTRTTATRRRRTTKLRQRILPSPAHFRGTVAAIVDQPDDLRELRIFHKALADVNRLRIVKRLGEGPATVGDLIDTVGLSQPLVSWHVSRLKAAGIVETRRAGREVLCQLRPNVFDEVAQREQVLLGIAPAQHPSGEAAGPSGAAPIPAVEAH